MIRSFLLISILSLVSDLNLARAESFVYVSAKADKQIVVYRLQDSTGEVDLVERVQAGGVPIGKENRLPCG
jgi:6-phosphogluconolactonase (cycloisomerase 2 family)